MKSLKFLFVMLAFVSLSSVIMAQSIIYVEPNSTHRVMCWNNLHETLDTECNINLNGDVDGNNQDTLKLPIGTTCDVQAGNYGDYESFEWMGIWDTYTQTIDNEGSWVVSKLSNMTGYTYVGHFWVKFYEPNSVVGAVSIDISIYPNPVTNYLMIKYDRKIQWELVSVTGHLIKSGDEKRVDLNSLDTGYYVLKIMTDEGLITRKVLKQ